MHCTIILPLFFFFVSFPWTACVSSAIAAAKIHRRRFFCCLFPLLNIKLYKCTNSSFPLLALIAVSSSCDRTRTVIYFTSSWSQNNCIRYTHSLQPIQHTLTIYNLLNDENSVMLARAQYCLEKQCGSGAAYKLHFEFEIIFIALWPRRFLYIHRWGRRRGHIQSCQLYTNFRWSPLIRHGSEQKPTCLTFGVSMRSCTHTYTHTHTHTHQSGNMYIDYPTIQRQTVFTRHKIQPAIVCAIENANTWNVQ